MKLTRSWLGDHLETEATIDEIAERLTMLGLEVEGIEDRAEAYRPFLVAWVVEARTHPNADRLKICMVDNGTETVQVVCGAPNAREGLRGVFAPVGVHIPGTGLDLKMGKIRGEESNGMLLSERELGLSDDHEGIVELAVDAPVGASYADYAGLTDAVIDVALTPNRADCAGVRGIARDLAASGLGKLKPLDTSPVAGTFDSPIAWRRDFTDGAGDVCPMVVGRYFRNLSNGDSPRWLQDRLRAIGLRPISALVDITNYMTFDLARPLHVFDADTVAGDLAMRLAQAGEKIGALDGKSYALDQDMVVIADNDGVQAIGGVMGGEGSGCGPDTVNAFLEVALFDPLRIAATGRRLGIESDARYRFERGVDPCSALWGAEVAARLILDLCGGEASGLTIAGEEPDWRRFQSLRKARIAALGGVHLSDDQPARILEALGFECTDREDHFQVAIPSWRADIDGEADLVEEVLRIHGYDSIPAVPLERDIAVSRPALGRQQRRASDVRRALAARGLVEAVTFSFIPSARAGLFGGTPESLRLVNPISADLDVMRPSVLANLIEAVGRNADRGQHDGALFEIGPHYEDASPAGEIPIAAGVRAGLTGPRHWSQAPRPRDAFDAKADALAALAAAGAPMGSLQANDDAPGWYHPGRSGSLCLGAALLARFGEVHPRVLREMDVDGPVAAFEVFLANLPEAKRDGGRAGADAARPVFSPSLFQAVERDFAFVVDRDVAAGAVVRAAKGAERKLISEVVLFDVYEGPRIADGQKSVTIAVTLQPTEATLTDAEIEAVAGKIVAAVKKSTSGELRT